MNSKITQALSDFTSGDITAYFNEVDKIIQLNDGIHDNKILSMEERVTLNQILALFPDADHNKEEGKHIGWWLDDSYYEFIGYNWGFYGRPWLDFDPVYEEINGQRTCIIHFTVEPVHEEAYDVDEMLETKARIEDELSIKHISDEIDQIQKQSQK